MFSWRGTPPTTAESCPAPLPHFLKWASTGARSTRATSIARAFPQTFPVLLACTGTKLEVDPSLPQTRGRGGGAEAPQSGGFMFFFLTKEPDGCSRSSSLTSNASLLRTGKGEQSPRRTLRHQRQMGEQRMSARVLETQIRHLYLWIAERLFNHGRYADPLCGDMNSNLS